MRQLTLVIAVALLLLGCVRTPTQETHVVDDRPRISFDVSALEQKPRSYHVRVDGVDFGSIDQYLSGKNALPLLPGKHTVEVLLKGNVIFTQKVYLGENSARIVKVMNYD